MAKASNTEALLSAGQRTISLNYAPQAVVMDHGLGMRLFDTQDREYLDFVGGIAVSSLGHAHPKVVEALREQVAKLLHVSNIFFNEPQILLQSKLVELCFADRVFLCNSGAEANEAAIKLARRYQKVRRGQTQRVEIVAAQNSFHGRTMGAIAATGQPKYWAGFEPLPPGFVHIPFNDLAALDAALGDQTAALLLEPVQGESGVRPATMEYLQGARKLCDERGVVLIFDEVQCGLGRIGTLWAHQHYGIQPDIMTLAKGIAAGLPMGVMLATEELSLGFEKGSHASTFGGNPVAARAALVVLEAITEEGFLEQVIDTGSYLREQLAALAAGYPQLAQGAPEVRGLGLMIGLEVGSEWASKLMLAAREEGLLINLAGPATLRFVPPLIAQRADVDEAIERLSRAFAKTL
ncbi:MAG: acetylornithine transaminase [Myxococcota bacterium]|jgi:acetylornithine/N-succinyldiaminopimelate aminotransferase|nr:acetylornithine transaminase [Myxococcota bacterium]